jgi:hypothetical protein
MAPLNQGHWLPSLLLIEAVIDQVPAALRAPADAVHNALVAYLRQPTAGRDDVIARSEARLSTAADNVPEGQHDAVAAVELAGRGDWTSALDYAWPILSPTQRQWWTGADKLTDPVCRDLVVYAATQASSRQVYEAVHGTITGFPDRVTTWPQWLRDSLLYLAERGASSDDLVRLDLVSDRVLTPTQGDVFRCLVGDGVDPKAAAVAATLL